jgi:hypothetical protein
MKYILIFFLALAALSVGCSNTKYAENGARQIGIQEVSKVRFPDGHDYWRYCGGLSHAKDCVACQKILAEIGGN